MVKLRSDSPGAVPLRDVGHVQPVGQAFLESRITAASVLGTETDYRR
jgi:hypothetical protein